MWMTGISVSISISLGKEAGGFGPRSLGGEALLRVRTAGEKRVLEMQGCEVLRARAPGAALEGRGAQEGTTGFVLLNFCSPGLATRCACSPCASMMMLVGGVVLHVSWWCMLPLYSTVQYSIVVLRQAAAFRYCSTHRRGDMTRMGRGGEGSLSTDERRMKSK